MSPFFEKDVCARNGKHSKPNDAKLAKKPYARRVNEKRYAAAGRMHLVAESTETCAKNRIVEKQFQTAQDGDQPFLR